jgi:hypothetical protein
LLAYPIIITGYWWLLIHGKLSWTYSQNLHYYIWKLP